jgi:nitroreductase
VGVTFGSVPLYAPPTTRKAERMALLDLDPDQLLFTTRAVRKRLDFAKPVDDELVRQCVAAALQAPSGSNNISMRFIVVKDPAKRAEIGRIYASCFDLYRTFPHYAGALKKETPELQAQQDRVTDSANYLADRMGEAPVLVIGATEGARADGLPAAASAAVLGNIIPGMWSFMLAARARGLGTAWTTLHLIKEREVADVLGIPFDTVQQVVLSPLAHTVGTDFKPALRPEPDTVIRWDGW